MEYGNPVMITSNMNFALGGDVVEAGPNSNSFVRDISIITAFMATNYAIHKAAPHVRPAVSAIARRSGPYLNQLSERARGVADAVSRIRSLLRRRNEKETFVRFVARSLPSFIFDPAPRIFVLLQGVSCASANEILRDRQIRPALSELEEFNDEGIIVAYAKTSDSESEAVEPTDALPDFGFVDTWPNTNLTMKFDPWTGAGGCSTPMGYASPVHQWLATSVNPPAQFTNEESAVLEANATKIATLEAELIKMKAMVETILQSQANFRDYPPAPQPIPITTQQEHLNQPSAAPPPPPPPPPPPAPIFHSALNGQKIIKLKTKTELESNALTPPVPTETTKAGPLSMSDVLKGLSNVKLKPVERSPGGTPFKPTRISNETDPAAMIAAALKKRFASIQSPALSNVNEEDSFSDKENQPLSGSDSFSKSPSFFQFGKSGNRKKKSSAAGVDSPLGLKRSSSDQKLNTSFPKKRKSTGSPAEQSPIPLFGQHLLKRRVTNSLQKKLGRLSLGEETNN